MHEGSRKAIIAAFFANMGIAIAKFVGFLVTGSAGLLAESGHSLADTGNQGLLMFGSRRGKRPADRAHPFGYGPERYFWSFVVALVLFSMGGLAGQLLCSSSQWVRSRLRMRSANAGRQ